MSDRSPDNRSGNTEISTPSAQEPVLRPHVFDGIQEYDQRLPNWWLMTFYLAMTFFVLYWTLYYQGGFFQTDEERVVGKISAIQQTKTRELEKMVTALNDGVLWAWSRDPAIKAEGQAIYSRVCSACHAPDLSAKLGGVALPGLPLNDAMWKYGGNPMDVFRMVGKGSPDKSQPVQMPPWESVLSPAEMARVAAYVMSFHPAPPAGP